MRIKNILLLIVLLFTIIPSLQTSAFEMKVGDDVYVSEEVNEDLYIAGGNINVDSTVDGDLLIAGGQVNVSSNIEEDLMVAAGEIVISGEIGDDVRVAGGLITINSKIEGDLIIGAGEVRISKGTIVEGDLVIGAGIVVMDGEIMGDAKITAGQLTLNGTIHGNSQIRLDMFKSASKSGSIKGNLDYKSDSKIEDLENISDSEVVFTQTFIKEKIEKNVMGFVTPFIILKLIGLFLFSTLIYFYFQKLFSKISSNLENKTGKSFLYGFLTIVGTPFIILLLLISVIGIPFALLLFFTYIFMFVFLSLINVIVLSSFLIDKYSVKELYKKFLIIFTLTLIFGLINGISLIAGLFTLGAIMIKEIKIIESLRK